MNNAKITITIPYDQIPKETENLISKSLSRMSVIVQELRNGNVENYQKTLEDIESARQKLILVDANLEDAYNILLGYLQNELALKQEKVSANESKNI